MSLISPDNDLALMAVLFVIAGVAFLAEKTRVGSHLTGAVIAILSAIAVANLRIIPHSAPAFDFVFSYFVPVLIPLFLFKADLRHMLFETTRMTGTFLIASLGTVIGVIVMQSLWTICTAGGDQTAIQQGRGHCTDRGGPIQIAKVQRAPRILQKTFAIFATWRYKKRVNTNEVDHPYRPERIG